MSTTETNLFVPPKPPLRRNPCPDFWNIYAREVHKMPPDWSMFELDCSEEVAPKGFTRVQGGVAPVSANGSTNWKKMDKATVKTLFINMAEFDKWKLDYAKAQGKCLKCWSTGEEPIGFSIYEGAKFRKCACQG